MLFSLSISSSFYLKLNSVTFVSNRNAIIYSQSGFVTHIIENEYFYQWSKVNYGFLDRIGLLCFLPMLFRLFLCALIVFVILRQTDILTHMMFLFNRLLKPIQKPTKKEQMKKKSGDKKNHFGRLV